MKKVLQKVKSYYLNEIKLAEANGYEAVILPISCDYELHGVYDSDDLEYIYDIVLQSGWDNFIIIDFSKDTEKFVSLYELEAA